MNSKPADSHERITAAILKALDGPLPAWRQPWRSIGPVGSPRNAVSERPYHGINFFLLAAAGCAFGDQRWLTYRQAQALGGNVRRGQHGETVVFWKVGSYLPKDAKPGDNPRKSFLLRTYTVFNVAQCDGLKLAPVTAIERKPAPEVMRELVTRLQADVRHGAENRIGSDRAFYAPWLDFIGMPEAAAFTSPDAYAATLLHELGHWTGHKARLDRDLAGRFGSESYAAEELVAELTSAYMCAQLGINCELEHHASYIENWRRVLKSDARAIVTAASKATAAANFIADHGGLAPTADDEADSDAAPEVAAVA